MSVIGVELVRALLVDPAVEAMSQPTAATATCTPSLAAKVVGETLLLLLLLAIAALTPARLVGKVDTGPGSIRRAATGLVADAVTAIAIDAVVVIVAVNVTRSEPACEALATSTSTTKAAIASKRTRSNGITSILTPTHTTILASRKLKSCIPTHSAQIAIAVPTASRSSESTLTNSTTAAAPKFLLVLLLSDDLVPELINVPPVRTSRDRPRSAVTAKLFLFGVDFGFLELDLAFGVGEDAIVAGGVGRFGSEGEAVAEFAERAGRGEISRLGCVARATPWGGMCGAGKVAAVAAATTTAPVGDGVG